MTHTNNISKAISLLKQTLPEMNKRNIASTPRNYAIWYEYVSGKNKELVAAIKELDTQKTPYTPEILQSLYNEFISNAHEAAVNKLSESVREIIHDFLSKLGKEGQGLSDYAQTLAEFSQQADEVSHLDDIKDLVLHLINETQKREEATQTMQTSLESMESEMKLLRMEVSKINAESSMDSLTKINNRQAFDTDIEGFIYASKENSTPLCLIVADVDQFKVFNDTFGHTVGDKVLRFIASLIKNNIKGRDAVARYSGKQFALLLPETNYEGALVVAENIREKLAKQTLSDSAKKIELGTITASFGVTSYEVAESSEQFVQKALSALTDAKKSGRNKVIGNNKKHLTNHNIYRTVL